MLDIKFPGTEPWIHYYPGHVDIKSWRFYFNSLFQVNVYPFPFPYIVFLHDKNIALYYIAKLLVSTLEPVHFKQYD